MHGFKIEYPGNFCCRGTLFFVSYKAAGLFLFAVFRVSGFCRLLFFVHEIGDTVSNENVVSCKELAQVVVEHTVAVVARQYRSKVFVQLVCRGFLGVELYGFSVFLGLYGLENLH